MSDTIRRIFTGKIFSVSVETVTLPNGRRLEAELVHHAGSVVLCESYRERRRPNSLNQATSAC